jgi:hypothetical protein
MRATLAPIGKNAMKKLNNSIDMGTPTKRGWQAGGKFDGTLGSFRNSQHVNFVQKKFHGVENFLSGEMKKDRKGNIVMKNGRNQKSLNTYQINQRSNHKNSIHE